MDILFLLFSSVTYMCVCVFAFALSFCILLPPCCSVRTNKEQQRFFPESPVEVKMYINLYYKSTFILPFCFVVIFSFSYFSTYNLTSCVKFLLFYFVSKVPAFFFFCIYSFYFRGVFFL